MRALATASVGIVLCLVADSPSATAAPGGTNTSSTTTTSSTSASQSFMKSGTPVYTSVPTDVPAMSTAEQAKTALRSCFLSGECYQPGGNSIYEYPMPCEGSNGASCSGCWKRSGPGMVRVGPLDTSQSDETKQCKTGETRVFLGYQMKCPAGTPVGGSCQGGKLILGCRVSGEKTGNAKTSSYFGECFNGNPIVVDPTNMTSMCDAGLYRNTVTGDCTQCAPGTYKPKAGDKPELCTACPATKDILSGTGVVVGTAPLITTGSGGSTSIDSCQYGAATCTDPKYVASGTTCIPRECTLGMNYGVTDPDPTLGTKGKITVSISGQQGTTSTNLVAPNFPAQTSTALNPSFSGLDPNTYTLSVADSICSRTATITLSNTPSCGLSLALTPTQPTAKTDGTSNADGKIQVAITGAQGTTTASLAPAAGTVNPSANGNPVSFENLLAGSYEVTVTDAAIQGCTRKVGAILTQGASSCGLGASITAKSDPTSTTNSDGSITVSMSNNAGPVTYTIYPNTGTLMTSPTSGTFSGLPAGNFSIEVKDTGIAGCSKTVYTTLNAPAQSGINCACYNYCGSNTVMCNANGPDPLLAPQKAYYTDNQSTSYCWTAEFFDGDPATGQCKGFKFMPGSPYYNQAIPPDPNGTYPYCGDGTGTRYPTSNTKAPCVAPSPSPTPPPASCVTGQFTVASTCCGANSTWYWSQPGTGCAETQGATWTICNGGPSGGCDQYNAGQAQNECCSCPTPNSYDWSRLTAMQQLECGGPTSACPSGKNAVYPGDPGYDPMAMDCYQVQGVNSGCKCIAPPACNLALSAGTITPPTASTTSDGSFSVNVSGAVGSVSYQVSPTGPTLAFSNNSAAAYTNAPSGNFTVIATDNGAANCTKFVSITVPAVAGGAIACDPALFDTNGARITRNSPTAGWAVAKGGQNVTGEGICNSVSQDSNPPYGYRCAGTVRHVTVNCLNLGAAAAWQTSYTDDYQSTYQQYVYSVNATSSAVIVGGGSNGELPSHYLFSSQASYSGDIMTGKTLLTYIRQTAGNCNSSYSQAADYGKPIGSACTKQDGSGTGVLQQYWYRTALFFVPQNGTPKWVDPYNKLDITTPTTGTTTSTSFCTCE
jgi:hypothetical protein